MALTRSTVLLCSIVLVATPASARTLKDKPLNKAPEISNSLHASGNFAEFSDMSARRRHVSKRYHTRRYATRYRTVKHARVVAQRRVAIQRRVRERLELGFPHGWHASPPPIERLGGEIGSVAAG